MRPRTFGSAVAFLFVGAPACCARPCNDCENVGYFTPRIDSAFPGIPSALPHSPKISSRQTRNRT